MEPRDADKRFTGSIPEVYDKELVPLIFEFYAEDLARRTAALAPSRVLEVAAGTGVVTRRLARTLPASTDIVATDLNQAMLDHGRSVGTERTVEWRQADAQELPFDDESFDVLVCQFGVMFFPDRVGAYAEALRVLVPGGTLIFNVWDRLEQNEFAAVVAATLSGLFPEDPPRFLARTPYGYHDRGVITRELAAAGFSSAPRMSTLPTRSRADSARAAAIAYCQGTPLRLEIEARDAAGLSAATDACARALATRYGDGAIEGRIQAHVVEVDRIPASGSGAAGPS